MPQRCPTPHEKVDNEEVDNVIADNQKVDIPGTPREPIVAIGTLATFGSLGRPPECVSRNDGEIYPSKPDAFGSFVRPPEDALRDMVPNGPLAPSGSLGRPPECEPRIVGTTAPATFGSRVRSPVGLPDIASPDFDDGKGVRCGTANRKLFAGPTPLADHGRVGEPPVTASGSSVPRRDPTPCPEVGLFQALVWRYRHSVVKNSSSGGSPRECLLRYIFASWQAAKPCQVVANCMRDWRPPAESKAKKTKGRKKQLPAGTVC